MTTIYSPLCQRDVRWKDIYLGNSALTIGDYGCLLTCFSMLAGVYPPTMNECRKKTGGYNGALAATFDISRCAPGVKLKKVSQKWVGVPMPPAPLKELMDHLKGGQPAIVEVDFKPVTANLDQHFVLAIPDPQVFLEKLIIIDPWTGETKNIVPTYGKDNADALWRYILYTVNEVQLKGARVATTDLNFRMAPNPDGSVGTRVGVLPEGAEINILETRTIGSTTWGMFNFSMIDGIRLKSPVSVWANLQFTRPA